MGCDPGSKVVSCGTTNDGHEAVRKRSHVREDGSFQRVEYRLAQPQISAVYRLYFNVIDIHNHYRHGMVSWHDAWRTKTWWHRFFADFIGFTDVNTFLALRHWHPEKVKNMSYRQFSRRLGLEMVNNPRMADAASRPRRSGSASTGNSAKSDGVSGVRIRDHEMKTVKPVLKKLGDTSKNPQVRCTQCGKRASVYCATCSDTRPDFKCIVGVCGTGTGRNCVNRHIAGSPSKKGKMKVRKEKRKERESPTVGTPSDTIQPTRLRFTCFFFFF